MKVMLIVAPNTLEERYGKLKYVGTLYPSMGLAAIAATAEEIGCEVKIVDCEAMGYTYNDVEPIIKEFSPDLVGLQTYCNTINRAFEIARRVKTKINPAIKVVLGGVQVTLSPEEYAQNEHVDFIVKGEGEIIFTNLVAALRQNATDFSHVRGLVWKKNGRGVNNPDEKLIENLDVLPFPARHLLPLEKYHPSAQLRGKRVFHVITSRGCPFRCGFCSCHKSFGRTYRFQGTERVLKEIRYLKETYKMDSIHFYDDNLTTNKPRIMDLCDALIREKLNMPWACFTRVDLVDPEMLKKMRESGCYQIFYGVESGTQRLLDLTTKGITIEQIKTAFRWTKAAGIEALASFMIGLPTETREESLRTMEFAREIKADFAHWEIFTPHPGTNLFEVALKHGKLLTTDWNKFSTWGDEPVYEPDDRSVEELKELKQMAYRKFYMRPGFILRRIGGLLKLPPSRIIKLVKSGLAMTH